MLYVEKKRIWAENFLRTYYKMKDMLKKREIEEKEMNELTEKQEMKELKEEKDLKEMQKFQKKRKEQIVKDKTQDMKAMILNMLNFDWIVPRLQQ